MRFLFREPLVAMLPVKHALVGLRNVPLERLHREPFIMCSRQPQAGFRETVLGLCRANGFEPLVAHSASSTAAMAELVAAGLGVALVPQSAAGRNSMGGGIPAFGRHAAPAGNRRRLACGSHEPRAAPLSGPCGQRGTAAEAMNVAPVEHQASSIASRAKLLNQCSPGWSVARWGRLTPRSRSTERQSRVSISRLRKPQSEARQKILNCSCRVGSSPISSLAALTRD